ncbi:hypothetical protein H8S90_00820 [Olivibacter sp. SDN3]|uniref:hypothetical protein n=1 Tax=Olivibacter sp. SDN3 TaxID=2764720 RepID=UPI0016511A5B|nr:hypothetical protein [Olivibacter sp. SDN3]QNL50209.1 hypothetical protein H8S90_00820 [Olivibacter sp. SDN3]
MESLSITNSELKELSSVELDEVSGGTYYEAYRHSMGGGLYLSVFTFDNNGNITDITIMPDPFGE